MSRDLSGEFQEGPLSDFLNEVRAQAGKKLSEAQAQLLTAAANDIRAQLGC